MGWTLLYSRSINKGNFSAIALSYLNPIQIVVRNNGLVATDTVNWGVFKIRRTDPAFAGGAYYYVAQPLYQGLQYVTFALPNYGTLAGEVYVNKHYFDLSAPVDLFQFT